MYQFSQNRKDELIVAKNKYEKNSNNQSKDTKDIKGNKNSKRRNRSKKFYNKNKNKANKGGNNYDKDKDRAGEEPRDTESVVGQGNDPKWYMKFPELVSTAKGVNFCNPLGDKINLWASNINKNEFDSSSYCLFDDQRIPGLMTFRFCPSIGYSEDWGSQINVAARNIYSYIRAVQTASASYEASDLMMYLVGMDSAYMFYAWMVRLYRIMSMSSPMNKYFPTALVHANGVDFTDLQKNLAAFRFYINMFSAKMGSIVLPKETNFTTRHNWMVSNILADSDSAKAQYYMFVPEGFYFFDDQGDENGTQLIFRKLQNDSAPGRLLSLSAIRAFGDKMIRSLRYAGDVGKMSGDILKTFGEGGIFKVAQLPVDSTITPVYDPVTLTQIQNMTIFTVPDFDDLRIHQSMDLNCILYEPKIMTANIKQRDGSYLRSPIAGIYCNNKLLTLPINDPSVEIVLECTRLVGSAEPIEEAGSNKLGEFSHYALKNVGTEFVTGAYLYDGIVSDNATSMDIAECITLQAPGEMIAINQYSDTFRLSKIENFAWHPHFYFCVEGPEVEGEKQLNWMKLIDIDNYTVITNTQLEQLHQACLISELTWDNVTTAVEGTMK